MRVAGRLRRVALRIVPAALVGIGLVLTGCDEQESPLDPSSNEVSAAMNQAIGASDKERNAADLGPAAESVQNGVGASSVSASGSTATRIPFAPEPGPFVNRGPSCDDCVMSGLPIGFSFTFFGATYTAFNLSSNGFIEFDPNTAEGCCAGRTIPSADGTDNIIAAAWTDLFAPGGGTISYETRGRAPNRFLVVAYEHLPWYPESGTDRVTSQIILFEGTNIIEIHTSHQSAGHTYTQGVEDASGTQAAFLPFRVAANYELVNDAVRYTTTPSWDARAPLPSARRNPATAVASGLLYTIGGANGAGAALRTVQAYNPSTNSWTSKASLPVARLVGNGAAMISGTVYLAGGQDSTSVITRTLYAYRTSTNTWSAKANMPAFSGCGGSAVVSGKLYVFSGCTRSSTGPQTSAALLHRYDPVTNSWTALRSGPAIHVNPAVGVIGGKLYVAGGNNGGTTATSRLDIYDPATNNWSTGAAMPTARVGAAGAVLGGRLYVIGGRNGPTYSNAVEVYDPLSNSWAVRASMPTLRGALGAGAISGSIYAVGGRNSTSVFATNERFTP